MRKAQEKRLVYRTEKRRNQRTGKAYAWIVKSTALVNHYCFYRLDRDFGPFFRKFSSRIPSQPRTVKPDTVINSPSCNWNSC